MRKEQDSIKPMEPKNQGAEFYLTRSFVDRNNNASDTSEDADIFQGITQKVEHKDSLSSAKQTATEQSSITQTAQSFVTATEQSFATALVQDSSIENQAGRSDRRSNSVSSGSGLFRSVVKKLSELAMPQSASGFFDRLSSNSDEEFTKGLKTFYDNQGNYYEAFEASQKIADNFFTKTPTLELNNFNLVELPKEISKLNHLRELSLSGNKLEDFTIDISKFKDLEKLDLSNNKLSFENAISLAKKLNVLKKFKSLNLSNNNFNEDQLSEISNVLNKNKKESEKISLSQTIVSADLVSKADQAGSTPSQLQARGFQSKKNTPAL